jgi:hypothetical protein
MMKYYRPETLYRQTKFDAYLNESTTPVDENKDTEEPKQRYRRRIKYLEQELGHGRITQGEFESIKATTKERFRKLLKEAST